MWFWTSIIDEGFVIMSLLRCSVVEASGDVRTFISVGVQGDGYVFLEIAMNVNNDAAPVYYRETATTLQVKKGWNYIAIHIDEIYEFSYVTMYLRNEQTGAPYYAKYETVFQGYYFQDSSDG